METDRKNQAIKLTAIHKLQQVFQKDLRELIDIYLEEAKRKLSHLYQAIEENNIPKLINSAQELRYRSVDIGALQFSHLCLSIEIAAQEFRFESLKKHLALLENQFRMISQQLEELKAKPPLKSKTY